MMARLSQPQWTQWYDIDTPNTEGDFECLSCIRQMGYNVCGQSSILQAECKLVKTGLSFTQQTVSMITNVLSNECTKTGLMCLNKDQPENQRCDDYAIRFKCAAVNNALKSMYWWIGVLTAVLIIISIMWFIFFLIRKRRPLPEFSNDEIPRDSTLAQPPPSYKDLFGLTTDSTSCCPRLQDDSSQSSQNVFDESEPSSVIVIGIESPIFSTNNGISLDNVDSEGATVNENVDSEGATVNKNVDSEGATVNKNASYIPMDENIMSDETNDLQIHASPQVPQPIIPWTHKTSVHRSPFPLLQPYSDMDDLPSYNEALKYLNQDWKSSCILNAMNE